MTRKARLFSVGLGIAIVALIAAVALAGRSAEPSSPEGVFAFDTRVTDREALRQRALGSEYPMEREFSSVAIWWALADLCVQGSDLDRGSCYDVAAEWLESVIALDVRGIRPDDWAGAVGGAMNIIYNETAKQLGMPKASDPGTPERLERPPLTWLCVPDCASAIGEAD